jgi:hypothetical protein
MTLLEEHPDRHWTVYYYVIRDYKEAKDLLIVKKGPSGSAVDAKG